MKMKKEPKFFSIDDYDKEAEYLREMHNKGWKFTGVSFPIMYNFVKTKPEDIVYQIDIHDLKDKDKTNYLQAFNERSWEYIGDYFSYSYFRKPAEEIERSDREEIFNEDKAQFNKLQRVFLVRLIPILLIFIVTLLPKLSEYLFQRFELNVYSVFILIISMVYLILFSRFVMKYIKLKNRYKQ